MPRLRTRTAVAASLLTLGGLLAAPVAADPTPLPPGAAVRLGADDRYGTAVAISRASFAPGVPLVLVASGEGFADALAAGPVAGLYRSPVLLVGRAALPEAVAAELRRLQPAEIDVLGGTSAVSPQVQQALRSFTAGPVQRFAGTDRYDTAAQLAVASYGQQGSDEGGGVVFLASGANYPDALAGGAAAGAAGAPVLLTAPDAVPAATSAAISTLAPRQVVLLGGPGAIAPGVQTSLQARGLSVVRLAGDDRYETSRLVAEGVFRRPNPTTVYLAVGTNYPDALGGAASAVAHDAPVLLSGRSCMPAVTFDLLQSYRPTKVVLLGGPAVIDPAAATTRC